MPMDLEKTENLAPPRAFALIIAPERGILTGPVWRYSNTPFSATQKGPGHCAKSTLQGNSAEAEESPHFRQIHMSTLNPTRKVSRRHELREDTVVTFYARVLGYFENNRNTVYAAAGTIVAVVVLILAFSWNQSRNNERALSEMAVAVQRYEAGNFQAALDGDVSFVGLIDVADHYGGTDSGNLAMFYAADALFRVGALDRSLEYFEAYSKDANYLGASAFAGEAAIRELQGDTKMAGDLFLRAASVFESDITSPMYLQRAARAYVSAGENGKALAAYESIRDDFPGSQAARNIEFFIAQVGSSS